MDNRLQIEMVAAAGTVFLALATFCLALLTYRLEKAWSRTSSEQIGDLASHIIGPNRSEHMA